jgi:adenylate cyclase
MALDGGERERTWLVRSLPDPLPEGTTVSQGDIAVDDEVAVRIRRAGDHRLATVQGRGRRSRTVIEWDLTPAQFDAVWPLTHGRRLQKVRHEVPIGAHTAGVDVFGGALGGLVLVGVAFDDAAAMDAFAPPAWFGQEVSDDPRYADAALARDGLPATG